MRWPSGSRGNCLQSSRGRFDSGTHLHGGRSVSGTAREVVALVGTSSNLADHPNAHSFPSPSRAYQGRDAVNVEVAARLGSREPGGSETVGAYDLAMVETGVRFPAAALVSNALGDGC